MSRSIKINRLIVLLSLVIILSSVAIPLVLAVATGVEPKNTNKDGTFDPNSIRGKSAGAFERLNKDYNYQWKANWSDLGTPRSITAYVKADNQAIKDSPENIAKGFLKKYSDVFLMKPNIEDLVETKYDAGLASHHVRFIQTYNGLKVRGSDVSVHMNKDGQIESVLNNYKPNINIDTNPTIPEGDSVNIAKDNVKPVGDLRGNVAVDLVIYPKDKDYYLSYQVLVPSFNPLGDWLVFVDAKTGNVLDKFNLIKIFDGTGMVFDPNPVVTSGDNTIEDNSNADSPLLTAQRQSRTLRDLDSSGQLIGPYADLTATGISGAYKPAGQANDPFHIYSYTRSDDRFEEVSVYYAVDSYQRYLQSLGFTNVNNRQIPIHAHYMPDDNAFYSSGDGGLHFGDGGVDDAEDADVTLHEYGHAMQDNQVPGFGSTEEGGSMGEGFGDYVPADFYADVNGGFQNVCIGDWDSTSYSSDNPPCLRRMDGTKHYPEDMVGEVHADGEIWSASLWEIRNALGSTIADRIIIESHFYLDPYSQFVDGANAIILADQNLYAGAHEAQIRTIFANRGILSDNIDPFGYSFIDSNTAGGPTYSWTEISPTGTLVLPENDDTEELNVPIGFNFNFYGVSYSQLDISPNGAITFGDGGVGYMNQRIGSTAQHKIIAPLWDDLTTYQSTTNGVYYQTMGTAPNRVFVVEWLDAYHYSESASPVIFEMLLYEGTGNVKFQYKDTDFGVVTGATSSDLPPYDNGGSATVGIEGADGKGLQYSFNDQTLSPGLAILFSARGLQVFARGTDNAIYNKKFDGLVWNSWTRLGGVATSDPDATSLDNRVYIFIRGTDNVLYSKKFNGVSWGSWIRQGGSLTSASGTTSFNGKIYVFARGTDNALYYKTYDGTVWSGWVRQGGSLTSGPGAASFDGKIYVFARGTDNALYYKTYDGTVWSGWIRQGGSITSDPDVASLGGKIYVFVRGTDNGLYYKTYDGTVWSSWIRQGGSLVSAPGVASFNGKIYVFVRGTDNALYYKTYDGTVWSGWIRQGGSITSGPGAE